jgi:hypothetical protein
MDWVIADWPDDGVDPAPVRAPSYKTAAGVWYRVDADRSGPVILRMEGEPSAVHGIAELLAPTPQQENFDFSGAIKKMQHNQTDMTMHIMRLREEIQQLINLAMQRGYSPPLPVGGGGGGVRYDPPVGYAPCSLGTIR